MKHDPLLWSRFILLAKWEFGLNGNISFRIPCLNHHKTMCYHTQYIYTRSRFLSPFHRERVIVPCKCGECAECQRERFNEWYYRIYHEWLDTIDTGVNTPYIFFDTLTYSNEYLPHLSEFVDVLKDTPEDYPCFSYEDCRLFMSRLRRSLSYHGYNVANCLRYFYCAEYGTADEYRDGRGIVRSATHRPHYHVLFFVRDGSLDVDTLRQYVDEAWFFGRTDTVRKYGDKSNYFVKRAPRSELAVSNYVAKYVQKVSKFQQEITRRLDVAFRSMNEEKYTYYNYLPNPTRRHYRGKYRKLPSMKVVPTFDNDGYISYCRSEAGKSAYRSLKRLVDQFHRQSREFGASVLRDLDMNELVESGMLTMPDSQKIVRKLPIFKYYERKCFEEQIIVDGARMWQPTRLGLIYRHKKSLRVLDRLEDKYKTLFDDYRYASSVTPRELARYVVYQRGRLNGAGLIASEPTIADKLRLPNLVFNYSSPSDVAHFHGRFVVGRYYGNSTRYLSDTLVGAVPIQRYCIDNVYIDPVFEKVLRDLDKLQYADNERRQSLFDYLQDYKSNKLQSCQLELFVQD